ncbi:hypothetical protein [Marinobacter zhejiangensis]|uniref:Uncharacterized protein n=1 Tax=Marinobacter zhejiangensis TaxID=488535 RepID=A0A1I4PGN9_9GAMM|nr:hypothetical protein [Marinobacter zhejiangensis]SFM26941.1 hypothetical protein SAMN04487963_2008 [Marinobacter zhejiangensis]
MTNTLPNQFSELESFVEKWAKPTENERQKQRITSTPAELKAFYDHIMPRMEEVLQYLDNHPYGQLPKSDQPLYWMALSLAEIAPHVELYGGDSGVPYAFEEARFVAEHGNTVNV